jgi:hypothetical protein
MFIFIKRAILISIIIMHHFYNVAIILRGSNLRFGRLYIIAHPETCFPCVFIVVVAAAFLRLVEHRHSYSNLLSD